MEENTNKTGRSEFTKSRCIWTQTFIPDLIKNQKAYAYLSNTIIILNRKMTKMLEYSRNICIKFFLLQIRRYIRVPLRLKTKIALSIKGEVLNTDQC